MTPTELRNLKINAYAQAFGAWAIGLCVAAVLTSWLGLNGLEQLGLGILLYPVARRPLRPYWTALATYRERENEDA